MTEARKKVDTLLAPNHLTSAVNVLNSSMSISTILAQETEKELRYDA